MKNEMNIQWMDINSIKPYGRNAKKHPAEQVEHIANSLKRFGWKQPLVIDKNVVIVVGHGRLFGAKRLGMDTVPCVLADDLTETEIRAYRLADNKLNESDWEIDLMDIELDEIEELSDIDMSDFGFELSDGGLKCLKCLKIIMMAKSRKNRKQRLGICISLVIID